MLSATFLLIGFSVANGEPTKTVVSSAPTEAACIESAQRHAGEYVAFTCVRQNGPILINRHGEPLNLLAFRRR
jgi:hypothetical protein